MNKDEQLSRGKSWDANEVSLCLSYLDRIKHESRARGVSYRSPSLLELYTKLPSRSLLAVGAKCRVLMQKHGIIKTRKEKNKDLQVEIDALKAQRDRLTPKAEEAIEQPQPLHAKKSWWEDMPTKVFDGHQQEPVPSSHVVSIPLKNLYGKVDFETFISLIK